MLEGTTMEMSKIFISIFMILSIASVSIFFINLNQAQDFKQMVNYQIERHGGLTTEAQTKIKNYSKDHFDNQFTVTSNSGTDKMEYGKEVSYTVNGKIKLLFITLPVQNIAIKGAAISMVR